MCKLNLISCSGSIIVNVGVYFHCSLCGKVPINDYSYNEAENGCVNRLKDWFSKIKNKNKQQQQQQQIKGLREWN